MRIGTRASKLALAQAEIAAAALRGAAERGAIAFQPEVVPIRTKGDAITDRPFESIGPKGVFAVELQRSLLEGEVDVAVHSLKDLPSDEPAGLALAAACERADARDVLVSREGLSLDALPPGAVVGTSSSRRLALVAMARPDLQTAPLRGNVDTRLEKVSRGDVDAAVLAAAGLVRLGRDAAITEWLDPKRFVPPPGQGAIVIETRIDRLEDDLAWVTGCEHSLTRSCVDAEREFMRIVEGGCEVPLGAWARFEAEELVCDGLVVAPDGSTFVHDSVRGGNALAVGKELAERVLAAGGAELVRSLR